VGLSLGLTVPCNTAELGPTAVAGRVITAGAEALAVAAPTPVEATTDATASRNEAER
jgi:hypothetical protein